CCARGTPDGTISMTTSDWCPRSSSCTIWYMILDSSIEIDAAPAEVWAVFTDVERWSEWTASVTSLRGLDGPELAVGRRFAIKQPRMPRLVWEVTSIDPGR